jgi:hypothetical protein
MSRPDRIGDFAWSAIRQAGLCGLDKHPETLLELFRDSSNIQAGRQPDTIANGLSR